MSDHSVNPKSDSVKFSPAVTDYTTWRKGKRTDRGYKIGVCPKCGRKGAIRPSGVNRHGQYCPVFIQHRTETAFGMTSITNWCEWDDRPNDIPGGIGGGGPDSPQANEAAPQAAGGKLTPAQRKLLERLARGPANYDVYRTKQQSLKALLRMGLAERKNGWPADATITALGRAALSAPAPAPSPAQPNATSDEPTQEGSDLAGDSGYGYCTFCNKSRTMTYNGLLWICDTCNHAFAKLSTRPLATPLTPAAPQSKAASDPNFVSSMYCGSCDKHRSAWRSEHDGRWFCGYCGAEIMTPSPTTEDDVELSFEDDKITNIPLAAEPQPSAQPGAGDVRKPDYALLPQSKLWGLTLDQLREARLELPACEQAGLITHEQAGARHRLVQAMIEHKKRQESLKAAQDDERKAYKEVIEQLIADEADGNPVTSSPSESEVK